MQLGADTEMVDYKHLLESVFRDDPAPSLSRSVRDSSLSRSVAISDNAHLARLVHVLRSYDPGDTGMLERRTLQEVFATCGAQENSSDLELALVLYEGDTKMVDYRQ